MNDTKSQVIAMLFAWIPYTAVAWGYTALTDGTWKDFWYALGVLLVARLFFSVIETLGTVLLWRAYGKRVIVEKTLGWLRESKFPKRESVHEDFTGYLARIENEPGCTPAQKLAAHDCYVTLLESERAGILRGARMHSATEAAFELYSPKSEAPTLAELFKRATAEDESAQ